jgi:DMSO/TMAO reductase YedYZ molybdopterin-dependent catalytic subunit
MSDGAAGEVGDLGGRTRGGRLGALARTRFGQTVGGRRAQVREAIEDPPAPHDTRTAAILGVALGISFFTCFLTGLYSHLAQHPTGWFTLPARPAGLFRITQAVHVTTGIATIPLLLAKLWAVFPHLFKWPPVRSFAHVVERLSLIPLVGGALLQLWTGVANVELWYPLPWFFPVGHYWTAWVVIGALVIHIGAKITTTRAVLRPGGREVVDGPPSPLATGEGIARRRFLTFVGAGSGFLTLVTIGQTVGPLKELALLAPRRPDVGDSGFPVNGAAAEAHVIDAATSADWRLEVIGGPAGPKAFTLAELNALPQHEATLPIACVEGWSAQADWRGVSLRTLLDAVGVGPGVQVTVHSIENGLYAQSDVNAVQTADPDTLLALEANGEVLSVDHGYPVRLIGPNRPGVMQTKWLRQVVVA